MKKFLHYILPILFVCIIWELVSRSSIVSPYLFPPPTKVLQALLGMVVSGTLIVDIKDSLWRLILGLLIGSSLGIVVGLLTGRIKIISRLIIPIVQVLRPLPPVAIIPLVIIWFGIGDIAKIFSISFAVFFPVWINTYMGSQQIAETFIWSAKLLTKSTTKIFHKVILPATIPFIITGIRTSIAIAFVMIFVSELAGASSGLGYRISISQLAYRIDEMIAALLVLGMFGALADYIFIYSFRKIFPWLKHIAK